MAKRRIPWLILLPPLAFAALAGLLLGGMYSDRGQELPTALAGQPAPTAPLAPLGGGPAINTSAFADGEVKLVNFFASWCAPCRAEHPVLTEFAQETGVPIYGVAYKDIEANALGFLDELGSPYAALGADPSGRAAVDWGVYGVPETFVIDGEGRVIDRIAGPVTARAVTGRLLPALAEAGAD
ncbi:DsbE family thiol:disulfide interchange protein [Pseudoroseicyclus aestuarii]|uniref:Cytochrome c biogenesis protein CcmG/thiol:disulfide interchange protein DsbE n=1 Tax=Pseudoroseicyclus aestuarii TaxID=1795041 RepID=A0A318SU74_9RHOB|nr:DsbE family thiol:disulfide interchange protein [Pseudoroseicyclus aestuarii]PYE85440.1 cytochrome c biogenesis protein CcmG/thiol:disulfide interchange protein DsbE [Pseudoroseicyclus aestuarii]